MLWVSVGSRNECPTTGSAWGQNSFECFHLHLERAFMFVVAIHTCVSSVSICHSHQQQSWFAAMYYNTLKDARVVSEAQ